jgi:hypothetical protein
MSNPKANVVVNKITGSIKNAKIDFAEGGYITNYGGKEGCVAIGYKGGKRDYMLSVTVEDMRKFLDTLS